MALRSLLDLEKRVIDFNDAKGWEETYIKVKPSQMLGLEINPYAAELARTALWIGYIQWHQSQRYPLPRTFPYWRPWTPSDRPTPSWPTATPITRRKRNGQAAEFIIGNPPFLGGKPVARQELGDEYVNALVSVSTVERSVSRMPVTIVCYWFENARAMLENGKGKIAPDWAVSHAGNPGSAPTVAVLQRIKESPATYSLAMA